MQLAMPQGFMTQLRVTQTADPLYYGVGPLRPSQQLPEQRRLNSRIVRQCCRARIREILRQLQLSEYAALIFWVPVAYPTVVQRVDMQKHDFVVN